MQSLAGLVLLTSGQMAIAASLLNVMSFEVPMSAVDEHSQKIDTLLYSKTDNGSSSYWHRNTGVCQGSICDLENRDVKK